MSWANQSAPMPGERSYPAEHPVRDVMDRRGNSVTITRFPHSTGPTLDGGQPEILTSRIAHDA